MSENADLSAQSKVITTVVDDLLKQAQRLRKNARMLECTGERALAEASRKRAAYLESVAADVRGDRRK